MTFKYRYRKQILLGILIFVIVIGCGVGGFFLFAAPKKEEKEEEPLVLSTPKKENKKSSYYKVDIKGEVINPGIYSLKVDSRVIDVINKAGGITENADTTVINLSKKIVDEMVIIIYSKEQIANFERTKEMEEYLISKCEQKDENSLKNDACISNDVPSSSEGENSKNQQTGKVSLNKATKEELMTLSGIGEAKAEDIIKYREENGGFKTIDEIKNVSGIGDAIFVKIQENITL